MRSFLSVTTMSVCTKSFLMCTTYSGETSCGGFCGVCATSEHRVIPADSIKETVLFITTPRFVSDSFTWTYGYLDVRASWVGRLYFILRYITNISVPG